MNFLSRIIRFLFWIVVVTWGIRLLRWVFRPNLNQAGTSQAGSPATTVNTEAIARRLVRDPVCGTHVAEVLAIPLRDGSETVHFCSVHCRDQYVASIRKFAANA
jgi:YHS domain-containing protein